MHIFAAINTHTRQTTVTSLYIFRIFLIFSLQFDLRGDRWTKPVTSSSMNPLSLQI